MNRALHLLVLLSMGFSFASAEETEGPTEAEASAEQATPQDTGPKHMSGMSILGNEETLKSLAVLTERLDRVKKLGKNFAGISFSPSVKKLTARRHMAAVV